VMSQPRQVSDRRNELNTRLWVGWVAHRASGAGAQLERRCPACVPLWARYAAMLAGSCGRPGLDLPGDGLQQLPVDRTVKVGLAGSSPEMVGHYAVTVVAAAYRRGFHAAGGAIIQAAEELPQGELFEHLVSIGRGQRTATERPGDVMAVLG